MAAPHVAGAGSPNRLLYLDPERVGGPPAPATATPVVATPAEERPQVQRVVVDAPREMVAASVLALTGGDPRAMLVFGMLLLGIGGAALTLERRRALNAVTVLPTTRVASGSMTGFEFRVPSRR